MELGVARGLDPYDQSEETQVDMIAYILHRRSEAGSLDSLQGASARDSVYLHNLMHKSRKPKSKGTGDAALDAFNAWASKS